jgi:5-(hydroxymethyl)furfural/furfural oxidase
MRGVGANLRNHPCVMLALYLSRHAVQPPDNPWFLQNWLRFSSHHPGCGRNDMHLMPFNKVAWHALGARVGATAITVLQSHSTGRVELASADPAALPKVRFNLLADSRDSERLVAGFRFTLQLLTDPRVATMRRELFLPNPRIVASLARRNRWNALKARAIALTLDHDPLRKIFIGSSSVDPHALLADDERLREFVRMHAHPQLHDCGTCRMGRADDADAVVDGAGRVHGVDALRVVDASIFPTVPRGYPHFIVLMAAEKIADAIHAEWSAR